MCILYLFRVEYSGWHNVFNSLARVTLYDNEVYNFTYCKREKIYIGKLCSNVNDVTG